MADSPEKEGATVLRFSLLGSGSSGNATFVEAEETRVLIDAGISLREIDARLGLIGRATAELTAVLVSHEHEDHVRGLPALSAAAKIAVVATRGTLKAIRHKLDPATEFLEIRPGVEVQVGVLRVEAFPIPHDAREPCGFRVRHGDSILGHVTDLGMINDLVVDRLGGLNALVTESNHDLEMVRNGPYPQRLKRRILGPYGHLSNDAIAELLGRADVRALDLLVLAHLSQTNNRPDLARASAELALAERGRDAEVRIAPPSGPTPLAEVASKANASKAAKRFTAPGLMHPQQLRLSF